MSKTYNAWSDCDECGFQGLMAFHRRGDENYEDDSALGFMMDAHCPSCGVIEPVLIVTDEFREMEFLADNVAQPRR